MAARPPLSARQADVLHAIRAALDATGVVPSMREIGAAVGVSSPHTVWREIGALEAKGHIRRPAPTGASGTRSRAITLLDTDGRPMPATPADAVTRWCQPEVVLRIDVPDTPAPATCDHPRIGTNAWHVAGVVLCRTCGRAAVADYLAAKAKAKGVA